MSIQSEEPKRRKLRLSLRTSLVLLTVACVMFASLRRLVHRANQQRRVVGWVWEQRGRVSYKYPHAVNDEEPPIAWLNRLIGRDYMGNVVSVDLSNSPVRDVTPLAKLTKLEELILDSTQVSDMTPLANLANLEYLNLRNTQVRDVSSLIKLKNLKTLHLAGTPVNNVEPLTALPNIKKLFLNRTQIKDVTSLAEFKGLEWLHLSKTQVSDISPLAKLERLKWLTLNGTPVRTLKSLASLPKLKRLDLVNTQFSKQDGDLLRASIPMLDLRRRENKHEIKFD